MNSLKSFPLALSEPLTESEMLDILGGGYDSVVKTDLEDITNPEKSNKCDKCDKCEKCDKCTWFC